VSVEPVAEPADERGTYLIHIPVFPRFFYMKFQTSLIVGALVGTGIGLASSAGLGLLVGVATSIGAWLLWRVVLRPHPPIDRILLLELNTRSFTLTPPRSKQAHAQKPLGYFDHYQLKPGFGRFAPTRLILAFSYGEEWRAECPFGGTSLTQFVRTLDDG
jgi:hypothetical protein